jgi:hypothetical protein
MQASQSPETLVAVSTVMRLTAVPLKLIDGCKRRAAVFTVQPTYSLLRDGPPRILRCSVLLPVMLVKLLARGKFLPACLALELPVPHRASGSFLICFSLAFTQCISLEQTDAARGRHKQHAACCHLIEGFCRPRAASFSIHGEPAL